MGADLWALTVSRGKELSIGLLLPVLHEVTVVAMRRYHQGLDRG